MLRNWGKFLFACGAGGVWRGQVGQQGVAAPAAPRVDCERASGGSDGRRGIERAPIFLRASGVRLVLERD